MDSRSPVMEKLASIPPFWRLVFSLIVAGALLGVWLFAFVHNVLVSGEALPVALHSPLGADYSADAVARIPAARINLLRDAISDQVREGNQAPAEQLATIVDEMRTPVFTITPYPGMTTTPGRQPTAVRGTATPSAPEQTAPVVPSQTAAVPTITGTATALAPSATHTVTATQRYAITITPGFYIPTRTRTATHASYPTSMVSPTATLGLYPTAITAPTKTPQPTSPPVYQPSATRTTAPTSVPPTQTPVPPTRTLPPQPTNTVAPPTNTPVPPATNTPDDYPPPYP